MNTQYKKRDKNGGKTDGRIEDRGSLNRDSPSKYSRVGSYDYDEYQELN